MDSDFTLTTWESEIRQTDDVTYYTDSVSDERQWPMACCDELETSEHVRVTLIMIYSQWIGSDTRTVLTTSLL